MLPTRHDRLMDRMEKAFLKQYPKANLAKFRREYGENRDGRISGVYEFDSKRGVGRFWLDQVPDLLDTPCPYFYLDTLDPKAGVFQAVCGNDGATSPPVNAPPGSGF